MGWELDDSTLLKVSGAAALANGAWALASPRPYHDALYTSSTVFGEAATRSAGVAGSWLGAEQLVISARDDVASRDARKDMLKVAGVGWLACAANDLANVQSNVSPKDVGTALAVGKAVLGGLCLWRGIEDKLDRD